MSCGKCGNSMKLCPFSFGLALGLTVALGSFLWLLWVMYMGPTPMMVQFNMAVPDWGDGLMRVLKIAIKGFVSGMVFAFIYDFIACYCKAWCCKKGDDTCCQGDKKS